MSARRLHDPQTESQVNVMHQQVISKLSSEQEAIYRWLMNAYKMPSALAQAIAKQHRLGGELILWALPKS
jgi:ubiquinone biosynthesis protein COQ9